RPGPAVSLLFSSLLTGTSPTSFYTLSLHDALPIFFVFIAGYGTNLATVSRLFAPLQSALAARIPNAAFVRYSYTGTTFSGCGGTDRKSTRLNSSHDQISYAVFCLKKKKEHT